MVGERLGIWRGIVQGLSHPYTIQILYARNRMGDPFLFRYAPFPEVTILDPPLCKRADSPDDSIPHVYDHSERDRPVLCLFDPRAGGWSSDQFIADTILVWTASWLRFYEAWHATGVWLGGGAPHGPTMSVADRNSLDDDRPRRPAATRNLRHDLLGSASPAAISACLEVRACAPAILATVGSDPGLAVAA